MVAQAVPGGSTGNADGGAGGSAGDGGAGGNSGDIIATGGNGGNADGKVLAVTAA